MQSRIFATRKCQTRWQDVKPNSPVWQTPMFICDMIALSSVSQKNKIKAWISPSVAGDSHVKSTLSLCNTRLETEEKAPGYYDGLLLAKPQKRDIAEEDSTQVSCGFRCLSTAAQSNAGRASSWVHAGTGMALSMQNRPFKIKIAFVGIFKAQHNKINSCWAAVSPNLPSQVGKIEPL